MHGSIITLVVGAAEEPDRPAVRECGLGNDRLPRVDGEDGVRGILVHHAGRVHPWHQAVEHDPYPGEAVLGDMAPSRAKSA